MKKITYLTYAVLLALCSCTNEVNEEGFVDKTNTISFNAYSNKTRAYTSGDIDNATSLQNGNFGVVGYSGNSIYLGSTSKAIEQKYDSETSHWEYANSNDLKYWPQSGNMDFYAYFPYSASGDEFASTITDEGTVMTINNATGNQDVLFACALNQSYQERIPLTFYHAFSKINSVKIKVELNDVDVDVKKVEFINTTSSANSQVLIDKNGKASYGTSTGGTSTCGLELGTSVTISKSENADGYSVWGSTANKYLLATQGASETNNVTGTNKAMWDGTTTTWGESDKLSTKGLVCLKITGKVKTHSGSIYHIGTTDNDGVFYIPLKGTDHTSLGEGTTTAEIEHFFAGKRYNYTIILKDNVGYHDDGTPILKPILFSVSSVDAWDDVNVTINL